MCLFSEPHRALKLHHIENLLITILAGQPYHPVSLKRDHYQFLNLVLFSRDEDFQDQWGLLSKGLKNEHIEKNGISLLRVVSQIAYMSQQVSLVKKHKKFDHRIAICNIHLLLLRLRQLGYIQTLAYFGK